MGLQKHMTLKLLKQPNILLLKHDVIYGVIAIRIR